MSLVLSKRRSRPHPPISSPPGVGTTTRPSPIRSPVSVPFGSATRSRAIELFPLATSLVRRHRLKHCDEVLWKNVNDTSTRAVNVSNEKEGDRDDYRQDYQYNGTQTAIAIADQKVARDGDQSHQPPCPCRYEFRTSFIPETARVTTNAGCVRAACETADQSSACNLAAAASI